MPSNQGILFLEQVLRVCASCQAQAPDLCFFGSATRAADMSIRTLSCDSLEPGPHGKTTAAWELPIKPAPSGSGLSGRGSTATVMPSNQGILFLEKLSYYSKYCYINGNRFVVVLPCPSVQFSEFASLCLLLSGDVELYPGPDVKVILKELCNGQKTSREELNDLGKRMGQVEKTLQIVNDQADALAKLTKTVNELNETALRQQEGIINLEDRSRRNTHGLWNRRKRKRIH